MFSHNGTTDKSRPKNETPIILNTNKIQEKICAEIPYKPIKNSYKIVGLIFSKF